MSSLVIKNGTKLITVGINVRKKKKPCPTSGDSVNELASDRDIRIEHPWDTRRSGPIGIVFAGFSKGGQVDSRRMPKPRGGMPTTTRASLKFPVTRPWSKTSGMKIGTAGVAKPAYPRITKATISGNIPIFIMVRRRCRLLPVRVLQSFYISEISTRALGVPFCQKTETSHFLHQLYRYLIRPYDELVYDRRYNRFHQPTQKAMAISNGPKNSGSWWYNRKAPA